MLEKVIPWSKTPFDMSITDEQAEQESKLQNDNDEDDLHVEEIPQWLELFFDLGTTAS